MDPNIPGATNREYALRQSPLLMAGGCYVIVRNTNSSVTSARPALLTVVIAPAIDRHQPDSKPAVSEQRHLYRYKRPAPRPIADGSRTKCL